MRGKQRRGILHAPRSLRVKGERNEGRHTERLAELSLTMNDEAALHSGLSDAFGSSGPLVKSYLCSVASRGVAAGQDI